MNPPRAALTALSGDVMPPMRFDQATNSCPDRSGLYAIHGSHAVWAELQLGAPPDARPIYVGKAEASLVSRDLETHFTTGRTGQSTLRRSLAALLRAELRLEARPRNPARPERLTNFGLEAGGDQRLTDWMSRSLTLLFWPHDDLSFLRRTEVELLAYWQPPLNLKGVRTPWRRYVMDARAVMASEARAWAEANASR